MKKLLSLVLFLISFQAFSQNTIIPFTGRITKEGVNIPSTEVKLRFTSRLASGWAEEHIVITDANSVVRIELGSKTPIKAEWFKDLTDNLVEFDLEVDGKLLSPSLKLYRSVFGYSAQQVVNNSITNANLQENSLSINKFQTASPNSFIATNSAGVPQWVLLPNQSTYYEIGKNTESLTKINGALSVGNFTTANVAIPDGSLRFNNGNLEMLSATIWTNISSAATGINGVSSTGKEISLGGSLLKTTDIFTQSGRNLRITGAGGLAVETILEAGTLNVNGNSVLGLSNNLTKINGSLQLSDYTGLVSQGLLRFSSGSLQFYSGANWQNVALGSTGGVLAGSGLNFTGSTLNLGGTLNTSTNIFTNGNPLIVDGTGGFAVQGGDFLANSNSILGSNSDNYTRINGGLLLSDYTNSVGEGMLRFNSGNLQFYSANWQNVSTTAMALTSGNGVTVSGSQINLGGNLFTSAVINTSIGNDLMISGNGGLMVSSSSNFSSVSNFNNSVYANSGVVLGTTTIGQDGLIQFTTGNYYGYSGGTWNKFATVSSTLTGQNIVQGGNAFATALRIGTNDNHPIIFGTNNTPNFVIDQIGRVGIGSVIPNAELHVDKIMGATNVRLTGNVSQSQTVQMGQHGQGYGIGRDDIGNFVIQTELPYGIAQNSILTFNSANQSVGILANPINAKFEVNGNSFLNGFLTVNSAIKIGFEPLATTAGVLAFQTGSFYGYSGGQWNKFATVSATLTGQNIVQGGNSFATAMEIGTNDNFPLVFKINGQHAGLVDFNNNSFYGLGAGKASTGSYNVYVGTSTAAGQPTNSGSNNVHVGFEAGRDITTGSYNTFVGFESGLENEMGTNNAYFGNGAGKNAFGSNNTFLGNHAGITINGLTSDNTFVGSQAGINFQQASNSVILGRQAGGMLGTPSATPATGNIFLGYQAGGNETGSNKLYIENSNSANPLLFGDFANDFVHVNGNLALGFSTTGYTPFDGTLAFTTGSFYGYLGGQWNKFLTVSSTITGQNIVQGGNAFATAVVIGSNDTQPLMFKVDGLKAGVLDYGNTSMGVEAGLLNIGSQNTFYGAVAGHLNTTGSQNVSVGFRSGQNNTTGSYNTLLGTQAGYNFQSVSNSVMIGYQAGGITNFGATGTGNIFLGYQAGGNETGSDKLYIENSNSANPLIYGDFDQDFVKINGNLQLGNVAFAQAGMMRYSTGNFEGFDGTNWRVFAQTNNFYQDANNLFIGNKTADSGDNNTFLGVTAGNANTLGGQNVFIGFEAGQSNTVSTDNTFIGYQTGKNILNTVANEGSYNTFIGSLSGLGNTIGLGNTAMGVNSLQANQTGIRNTIMGYQAMMNGGTAKSNNVAIGYQAGVVNDSNDNTFIGFQAGVANAAGTQNTFVGSGAGTNNFTGTNNTVLGFGANVAANNFTNATALGSGAVVNASDKVRIGNASVTVIEGQVAFSNPSDRRLKENIQNIELGLDFIRRIRPVQYNMIKGNGKWDYGFIAQELDSALQGRKTNLLNKDGEYYGVRYNDLIAPSVKAIQELAQKVEALEKENAQLKLEKAGLRTELETQNTKISDLQKQMNQILELLGKPNTENGKK